jgi:ferredoxin
MFRIKIITSDNISIIESAVGHSLLDVLRINGYNIYAPCGGKGTCGKCRVKITGEDEIISSWFIRRNTWRIWHSGSVTQGI